MTALSRLLAGLLAPAISLLLLVGCAHPAPPSLPTPIAYSQTAGAFAPVDVSAVRVYDNVREADFPARPLRIASIEITTPRRDEDIGLQLLALRDASAPRGANTILRLRTAAGFQFVALRLDDEGVRTAYRVALIRAASDSGGSSPAGPATAGPPTRSSEDVHVRGYCRRDGVCVQPHTRSRPRSSGGSSGRRRP